MISILLQHGFSVADCADAIRVSERTVRRIRSGHRPSSRIQMALTRFYLHAAANLSY